MSTPTVEPFVFSGPLFRLIAPPLYLRQHLTQETPIRPSGRAPSEARPLTLTTASLSHAHGSAVVRAGDTAVVCGVRGEVLTLGAGDDPSAFETYKRRRTTGAGGVSTAASGGAGWGGLVVPNIEMSTGCSKNFPLGPPGEFAQTLAHRLHDLLDVTKLVDLKSLRIYEEEQDVGEGEGGDDMDTTTTTAATATEREIKGYWTLYLDVLCISLDGNVFDVAWMAMLAALSTARLPKAAWNIDASRILCSAAPELQRPVKLRKALPFATTFAGISVLSSSDATAAATAKTYVLADPDAFEQSEAIESLTVVVSLTAEGSATKIERIEKCGGRDIGAANIKDCVGISAQRARSMAELLATKTI